MQVIKCDNCDKIILNEEHSYSFWLTYPLLPFLGKTTKWQLCPACFRKFKKFMKADTEETDE